jgi:hypothetical protein
MRCDDVRKFATEGEPLDAMARAHLAECAACGAEFPELRALTAPVAPAPPALRDRVLAAFPARRPSRWPGLARAAAMLLVGLVGGFIGGFVAKAPAEKVVTREFVVERKVPTEAVPSDDYVFNVGFAASQIYGQSVEVLYDGMTVVKITVDPRVKNAETMCPVARQLGSLAVKRPDLVAYKKKEY